jgi:hypothetical protein
MECQHDDLRWVISNHVLNISSLIPVKVIE